MPLLMLHMGRSYGQHIRYLYGRCLLNNGDVEGATQMLEHIVKVEEKLAEDHPSRLASQHALTGAYRSNGQIDKAVGIGSRPMPDQFG